MKTIESISETPMDAGFFNGPISGPLSPKTPSPYEPSFAIVLSPVLHHWLDQGVLDAEDLGHLSEAQFQRFEEFAHNFQGNLYIERLLRHRVWSIGALSDLPFVSWSQLETKIIRSGLTCECLSYHTPQAILAEHVHIRIFDEDWDRIFYCPLSGRLLTHAFVCETGEVLDGDASFVSEYEVYQNSFPYFRLMDLVKQYSQEIQNKNLTQAFVRDLQALLVCPVALSSMHAPTVMNDGHVYERQSCEHLEASPMTRQPLSKGYRVYWLDALRHWLHAAQHHCDARPAEALPPLVGQAL